MKTMLELETERLEFRMWQEDDFSSVADFFSNSRVSQFVGGKKSPEEAWRLMASYIGHYQLKGYSYLAIVDKANANLVGSVGLLEF